MPLLHPAHTLAPGKTAFALGVSDRLTLGDEKKALDYAQERPPGAPPGDPRYGRGVAVALAEGPAVAPFAAARIGIVGANEAGLSYSGQAVRADARHAFEWEHSALSAGLGVTGRGIGQSPLDLPGTDLDRAHGFGLDLPLLYGYRTDADLISLWAGLRASLDHWSGEVSLDEQKPFALRANRLAAGPVLGLAIGLPPLWVAAEVEVDYAHITGSLDRPGARYDANVDGWSVHPAGALIGKF
ncbi:MAG: hypothetical protein ABW061_08235 [Polyangiaceae bacterium]